jgi:glyoxylase-like metal-dependent hydrolase (beta-lactamase superfamily II)
MPGVGKIVVVTVLLSACQQAADEPFAKIVPSAVIETRDEPTQAELDKETQVVMLGTGNPIPDAYRAGPSIAIIHKGEAYLFDVGAGAMQTAVTARYKYDIPSLYPSQICCVFFTHLHSDHTMDYAELVFRTAAHDQRGLHDDGSGYGYSKVRHPARAKPRCIYSQRD